jgi:hypothetical protein
VLPVRTVSGALTLPVDLTAGFPQNVGCAPTSQVSGDAQSESLSQSTNVQGQMPQLLASDWELIDDLFQMHAGYVLDFTSRGFSVYFRDNFGVDIDDPIFRKLGRSKAKRLRCFLSEASPSTAVAALNALWVHREQMRQQRGIEDWTKAASARLQALLLRLASATASTTAGPLPLRQGPRPCGHADTQVAAP